MNSIPPAELKAAAAQLPPSPRIFGKLSGLLRSPNADFTDITELVNADSSLTASVIRLSNSAMFSAGMPADTLEEAVNRIGFRELFKLVGIAAAKNLFNENNKTYGLSGSEIWENSLACGIGMEILAKKVGFDDQEAYTMGLLRNMGKMVIDQCVNEDSSSPRYGSGSTLKLVDWEENNFGITNPTVAGFVLKSWNFAEEVAIGIEFQYKPENAERKLPLTHLLNLANGIAEQIGRGVRGEASYWEDSDKQLPFTGLNAQEIEESMLEINEAVEQIVNSF